MLVCGRCRVPSLLQRLSINLDTLRNFEHVARQGYTRLQLRFAFGWNLRRCQFLLDDISNFALQLTAFYLLRLRACFREHSGRIVDFVSLCQLTTEICYAILLPSWHRTLPIQCHYRRIFHRGSPQREQPHRRRKRSTPWSEGGWMEASCFLLLLPLWY